MTSRGQFDALANFLKFASDAVLELPRRADRVRVDPEDLPPRVPALEPVGGDETHKPQQRGPKRVHRLRPPSHKPTNGNDSPERTLA